jgi:hypothetical protein
MVGRGVASPAGVLTATIETEVLPQILDGVLVEDLELRTEMVRLLDPGVAVRAEGEKYLRVLAQILIEGRRPAFRCADDEEIGDWA